jgi:toxin-antitoxin system PIN domain toxin
VHVAYRQWLDDQVNAGQPFALSVLVAVAFVRLVTNRRIFAEATPLPLALAVVDSLVERSNCWLVGPGPRHWALVAELCRTSRATGGAVFDAQHAAVAMEHGCEWVTRDDDFAAYEGSGLRWRHLLLGDEHHPR